MRVRLIANALLFAAVGFLIGCGPLHPQLRPRAELIRPLQRVAVAIPERGKFTVLARTAAGAWGGLGSLRSIRRELNIDEDADRSFEIKKEIQAPDCRTAVRAGFQDQLDASKRIGGKVRNREFSGNELAGFDGYLLLAIRRCGFRLIDQESGQMAAFVEIVATLHVGSARAWDDREAVVSSGRGRLEDFVWDGEFARSELDGVLREAGKRMALNLLYP